ncbi:hypothetical protein AUJ84_04240 [Candidatus Pacearchaeota archaeon CG1_02_32_132]|nr:MAG: hypothetical protein AUJ84_04240 [Candidatus Pacearchaeota archaeon CG1_02_32_132]
MTENIYPFFQDCGERGIIPNITLPRDYEILVPQFYARGGKKEIDDLVSNLNRFNSQRIRSLPEIRLGWNEKKGLAHISMCHGGLDINQRDQFQEHNLGIENGLYVGAVAITYIKKLINIK